MTAPWTPDGGGIRLLAASFVLAAAYAAFASVSTLPLTVSVGVGVAGAALGGAARSTSRASIRALAPVPPLVALGFLAVTVSPSETAALFGGLVAVVYVLWLAEDPDRLAGGWERALPRMVLPLLGVSLAWLSGLLLPAGSAPAGVGAGLLVAVVVVVALLVRSPRTFDRDPAASS